jgi:hypothetical protein
MFSGIFNAGIGVGQALGLVPEEKKKEVPSGAGGQALRLSKEGEKEKNEAKNQARNMTKTSNYGEDAYECPGVRHNPV